VEYVNTGWALRSNEPPQLISALRSGQEAPVVFVLVAKSGVSQPRPYTGSTGGCQFRKRVG